MNGGKISGNTGRGVYVASGSFTMNGGEISGNTSSYGGGVYVAGGIFRLSGGEISGNTGSYGGGVYVAGGIFRMVTGLIYGSNEPDVSLRNTASYEGSALYRVTWRGTVERGIFSGNTWNSIGNLATTSNTIRVVNGMPIGGDGIPILNNHIFNVSSTAEWGNALSTIAIFGSNQNYTINVTSDFTVAGHTTNTFGNANGITITLQGTGRTLTLSDNGNMLRIASNQNIILSDITLQGHGSNNASLVYVVNDGTFTMNGGVISGNSSYQGGGVYASGTFTMNGGEISGNTSSSNVPSSDGGGVYASGTFTMNGGKISSNTAGYGDGGGVCVDYSTFTMNGGEISGNTSYFGGGGVCIRGNFSQVNDPSVFHGGTFIMNGGEISGNTSTYGGGGVNISAVGNEVDRSFVFAYGATFIMNGGVISGNTASSNFLSSPGGGVYSAGYFYLVSGTIYGSNASPASLRNTASSGSALYVYNGVGSPTPQRGVFNGDSWVSFGNLSTTDNTIRVVNGNLQ
jgi:hypothetical protein